jgi:hypothetical protein
VLAHVAGYASDPRKISMLLRGPLKGMLQQENSLEMR